MELQEEVGLEMMKQFLLLKEKWKEPEILILDEPTNGLDPQGIHEIRQIITEIASKGTTILLASHLLDEVEKICSHVIVIRNGIKLYSGSVDEMTASKGFLELKIEKDEEKLLAALELHPSVKKVVKNHEIIIATLNDDTSATEMNTFLFGKGLFLSHLVKRKPSLEQQFLDLTNNN